ncbi:MAG: hypothetical protein KF847_18460 [Pirellulales bacterium]|nr:hypothetical protein [Pirellulales bacterium]
MVDELQTVRNRIEKYGSKGINEQDTKATLIQPVMRALGWDVEDLEDVQREYKRRKQDKPVDYALFLLRTPCLFVEAKALGQNLDDRKWANQIMGYAGVAGVGWVVLTDGNEYRLYNTHAAVPIEEKLFRTVRLSEDLNAAAETLALLSRKRMSGNEIDARWNAFFVDRQVKVAVEELIGAEPDTAFIRLLTKRLDGLAPKDIRASLQRAEVDLSFPVAPQGEPAAELSQSKARRAKGSKSAGKGTIVGKRKRGNSPSQELKERGVRRQEQIGVLIANGYLSVGQKLSASYLGETIVATLTKDGKVNVAGTDYESVSAAGAAAKNQVSGKGFLATDGWSFWSTTDHGEQVPIGAIRDRYIATLRK